MIQEIKTKEISDSEREREREIRSMLGLFSGI